VMLITWLLGTLCFAWHKPLVFAVHVPKSIVLQFVGLWYAVGSHILKRGIARYNAANRSCPLTALYAICDAQQVVCVLSNCPPECWAMDPAIWSLSPSQAQCALSSSDSMAVLHIVLQHERWLRPLNTYITVQHTRGIACVVLCRAVPCRAVLCRAMLCCD